MAQERGRLWRDYGFPSWWDQDGGKVRGGFARFGSKVACGNAD